MTRLALFGGVYSNHHALAAVLRDIEGWRADLAWCLGDAGGFGPHPDRSIELLRAAGIPMLRGNYDHSVGNDLADCQCGYTDPRDNHFAQISYDYTLANTSPANRTWLRPIDSLTMRSDVRGDFHEPYGAVFGFDISLFL